MFYLMLFIVTDVTNVIYVSNCGVLSNVISCNVHLHALYLCELLDTDKGL